MDAENCERPSLRLSALNSESGGCRIDAPIPLATAVIDALSNPIKYVNNSCASHPNAYFQKSTAGWSSLVARQAHNLKVVGSNPTPATILSLPLNYQVYVLQNGAGRLYVGLSADVSRRLRQHNAGVSRWTRGKGPWSLIWTSEALCLSEARKLENMLKRQGRGNGFYSLTGIVPPGS